jgi:hypothetical protein
MVTTANLAALHEKRIDWITALKAPQVKALNAAGVLPLSLFDDRNLAEIDYTDYPDERLIVCHNPFLAEERCLVSSRFGPVVRVQLSCSVGKR